MIILPMAGESRRFYDAGYELPKYMLQISGRPLFDWVLLSFQAQFESERFLIVARDVIGTGVFLENRIRELGIARAEVVMLDKKTAGQAETVELGMLKACIANDTNITIFNIDTIRPRINIRPVVETSGWIEVFSAPGDNWSFVETNPDRPGRVLRCVEKNRISDLCCTGLYNFARMELFMSALDKERTQSSMNELYIAPLYNHLIQAGHHFGWRRSPNHMVFLSGVPAEYENLINEDLNIDSFIPVS